MTRTTVHRSIGSLAAALALAALSPMAHADEVYLTDGTKIVGTIDQLASGKLSIKSEAAGPLTIDATKIKGITTKDPLAVQLKSGERAVGPLNYGAQDNIQNVGGEAPRKLDPQQITALWAPGTESPDVIAMKKKVLDSNWSMHFELGASGQSGNSEIFGINGALEFKRITENDRLSIYANGRYTRDNGRDTSREIIGGVKLEVDLTKRLYAFGKVELENDEIEELDLRATAIAGLGYFIVREKDLEFKIHGGPGYQHESYSDGDRRNQAILELGEDLRWTLMPTLEFIHSINYYPTFDSLSDFRVVMENALEVPINPDRTWRIKGGVKHQYKSEPVDDVDRLDTFYFLNVVWDVK